MAAALQTKLILGGTAGLFAVFGGGVWLTHDFLKRMLTHQPQHFMDPEKIKAYKVDKEHIACDIPIPLDQEEEFDTGVLIEWYNDQQAKGLLK